MLDPKLWCTGARNCTYGLPHVHLSETEEYPQLYGPMAMNAIRPWEELQIAFSYSGGGNQPICQGDTQKVEAVARLFLRVWNA